MANNMVRLDQQICKQDVSLTCLVNQRQEQLPMPERHSRSVMLTQRRPRVIQVPDWQEAPPKIDQPRCGSSSFLQY
jgi:hypothetical protein